MFNYSNPHLISYKVLGETFTRLLISWSYDLHRFLSLLKLLTPLCFRLKSDLGLVISSLSSPLKRQQNLLALSAAFFSCYYCHVLNFEFEHTSVYDFVELMLSDFLKLLLCNATVKPTSSVFMFTCLF